MRKLVYILMIAALWSPSTAAAHHHAHHARHYRAHAAWVVTTGCESPDEPTWTEWRRDMAGAGFTQADTEAYEVCDED